VIGYLVLDLVASVGDNRLAVIGAFVGMELTIVYAIAPLATAAVVSGVVNALASRWGLFEHYWVVIKLLLTVFATAILFLEIPQIRDLAVLATSSADPTALMGSLPHSIGAVMVLITIIVLSVYKPRGLTPHGWRKRLRPRAAASV
jgi:hypothetical protein